MYLSTWDSGSARVGPAPGAYDCQSSGTLASQANRCPSSSTQPSHYQHAILVLTASPHNRILALLLSRLLKYVKLTVHTSSILFSILLFGQLAGGHILPARASDNLRGSSVASRDRENFTFAFAPIKITQSLLLLFDSSIPSIYSRWASDRKAWRYSTAQV